MNEFTELMKDLIRCRPASADAAAVDKATCVLKDFLESRGIYCVLEKINGRLCLYASTRPGKVQDLLLNSHVDVVPAASEDEYVPYEKDGWLYGRGAADCLGNTVCIARVLCAVKDSACTGAVFSSDEEIGGLTARAMVERGYGARHACIVLDAFMNHNIITKHKGMVSVKLSSHGSGGHSSLPQGRLNPIDKLVDAYIQLRKLWNEANPAAGTDWPNTMTPCIFSSGTVDNQIPTDGELVLNFRYTTDDCYERIMQMLQSVGVEFFVIRALPPLSSDENALSIQLLKQTVESVMERPVKFTRVPGSSDACHLKALGVPVAIMGVNGTGYHGVGEKMELKTLDELFRILTEYIRRLKYGPFGRKTVPGPDDVKK